MSHEVIGIWLSVFLTLAILSFLYRDNPFYKAAEHLFVGVSAGYWVAMFFWPQIHGNLFGKLWPKMEISGFNKIWYAVYDFFGFFHSGMFPKGGLDKGFEQNFWYLIPLFLGIFMLLRIVPKLGWLARWSMAYVVGLAAGLRIYGFLNSNILGQMHGTASLSLFESPFVAFNSLVVIVGTITGLLYFFFSREHKGALGQASRVGVYFLMISFGASFGFAVMGRISLLIGRFFHLIDSAGKTSQTGIDIYYATWILSVFMVISLAIWAMRNRQSTKV